MADDILLVSRFKNKDITAFDEIFSKYYKPVYYYIFKMIYNQQIAEDITQDTFIKVYKNLNDLTGKINLSSWIYRIAHNACIDYIRKNKINYELIDNLDYKDKDSNEPEQSYMNKELREKIRRVMLKIGNRYRSVLVLRDYNNLSYKEISVIMGCSEAAVKSLIHRARQEFQKLYEEVD